MIDCGLVDEVSTLQEYRDLPSLRTVGYSEIFKYLDGEWELPQAIAKIQQHSRNYAKRQITWFKNQGDYKHMDPMDLQSIIRSIDKDCDR